LEGNNISRSNKIKSKTLAVILTYNPEGKEENISVWREVIKSWAMQRNDEQLVDICVADCLSHPDVRAKLKAWQPEFKIHLLFINKYYRQHTCNNLAFYLFKGRYDYYAVCTSDAMFKAKNDLANLIADMNHHDDTALIVPVADHDIAPAVDCWHAGPEYNRDMQAIHDIDMPPTQFTVPYWPRAHLILYSRERYMKYFDYKVMDLTGSGYTQVCHSNLLASIRKKGAISHKVQLHHKFQMEMRSLHLMDYPHPGWAGCAGYSVEDGSGNIDNIATKAWKKFYRVIKNGVPFGLSYGHYLGGKCEMYDPDPVAFDENGYCKENILYHYMKEYFFLKPWQFDYLEIPYEWLPYIKEAKIEESSVASA
jgi:hypothetical protein